MSTFGFVYILVNDYMPDVYKIGCTERAPHARAEELSKGTGVPFPYQVLCYIEVDDFPAVEKELHRLLHNYRISDLREFFFTGIAFAVRLLYWHPRRRCFCQPLPHGSEFLTLWEDGERFPEAPPQLSVVGSGGFE